jgi:hypothetical protein
MTISRRFSQRRRSQPETRTVAQGWWPAGPQGWTTQVVLAWLTSLANWLRRGHLAGP